MKQILFTFAFLMVAFSTQLNAQALLSFQGIINNSDGTAVDNGTYSINFKLYESQNGGTPIWTETQDDVQVTGGIYSVLLGIVDTLDAPFDKTYYLGIAVDGGAEFVPRIQLTSSPYSLAVIGNTNVFASDGNVGVGTTSPSEKLEVIGNAKVTGNAKIDGDLEVTGGLTSSTITSTNIISSNISLDSISAEENVTVNNKSVATGEGEYRIIMGKINRNGTVGYGNGFTVTRLNNGAYKITFDTPFPSDQFVMHYTPFYHPTNELDLMCTVVGISANDITCHLWDVHNGGYKDADFMFTIIGPR